MTEEEVRSEEEEEEIDEEVEEIDLKEYISEIVDAFYPSCFHCKIINCFQLLEPHPDDSNFMGDLYFGKTIFNKIHGEGDEDLGNLICTNYHLFQCACFILGSISEIDDNIILRETVFQSIRDLKASIFLATAGYYRNSMQVLRCSFESILYGIYYYTDFKAIPETDKKRKKEIKKSYQNWKKGGVVKRIDVMSEMFRRIGLISKEEERDWKKLYDSLSKYIHTPRSTWGKKVQEKTLSKTLNCIAYNIFDKADFEIWSINFRKVFGILTKLCLYFEPNIKDQVAGQLAFKIIKDESINKKKDDPLKDLTEIINEIQSSSDYNDLLENIENGEDP